MQTSWPPQATWRHVPAESLPLQVYHGDHNVRPVAHCDHSAEIAELRREMHDLARQSYQMLVGSNPPLGQGNNTMAPFAGHQTSIPPPTFNQQIIPAINVYNTDGKPSASANNQPLVTIYNTTYNQPCSHRPRSPSPPPAYHRREEGPKVQMLQNLPPGTYYRYERSRSRSRSRSRTRWSTSSTSSSGHGSSSRRESRRRHKRSRRHDDDENVDYFRLVWGGV